MNYEELLNQYLDGTLTEYGEEVLFSAAANDTAFRREFSDALRLNSAVRQEAAAIIPPAALTNVIFSELGYSTTTSTPWFSGLVSKYWSQAASLAVGVLIAWVGFTQTGVFAGATNSTETPTLAATTATSAVVVQHDTVVKEVSLPTFASEQPLIVTERETALRTENRRLLTEVRYLSTLLEKATPETVSSVPSTNIALQPEASSLNTLSRTEQGNSLAEGEIQSSPQLAYQSLLPTTSAAQRHIPSLNIASSDFLNAINPETEETVEIYVRSLQTRPTNDYDVATNDYLGIGNLALGAMWRYNENLSLGLEVGREAFAQRYRAIIDNKAAIVYQKPTLWWAGISGRLEMPSAFSTDVIYPYIQGGYGWASGQYLRGIAGIVINPERHFRMHVGGEMVGLWYNAAGQNSLTTSKFGWMYSISYVF